MEFEIEGEKFKWWNEASRRARKKRTKNFQSRLFQDRNDKLLCGSTDFMKTCKIRLKEILQGCYFNQCFTREMSELLFYIICNGSSLGGTGKSRYSEDQIKYKVKNKLIKDVLPTNWEVDEWFVFWVDFYSTFIAIYYTHMKYRESKFEAVRKEEFGTMQKNHNKKLKDKWNDRKRREYDWWKIFWQNMVNCFGESDKLSRGEKQIWGQQRKREEKK
jgi:hypothetical protein